MTIKFLTKNEVSDHLQAQLTVLYQQLNAELRQLDLKAILENEEQTAVVICLDGDILIGIAMMAKYKVVSGYKGMIEDFVVASDYRGQGLGRALMEKLLEHAVTEKLHDVLLFSGHHRTAAISLYKSLGFTLKKSGLYIKKYIK